jgi:hypothetical protein
VRCGRRFATSGRRSISAEEAASRPSAMQGPGERAASPRRRGRSRRLRALAASVRARWPPVDALASARRLRRRARVAELADSARAGAARGSVRFPRRPSPRSQPTQIRQRSAGPAALRWR